MLDLELCSCGKCKSMPGGRVAAGYRVAVAEGTRPRAGVRDHVSRTIQVLHRLEIVRS